MKLSACFYINKRLEDLDNLLKFTQDALQGVVYLNDNCIDALVVTKEHVGIGHKCTSLSINLYPLLFNLVEPDDNKDDNKHKDNNNK
jgi:hypothetical protein